MTRADSAVRPIRLFGIGLLVCPLLSLGVFTYWLVSRGQLLRAVKVGYSLPVPIFVLLHVLLFLIGLGVVNFKSWGYRWFKAFLYVLLLCVPVGTIVAYVMLGYMA